MNLLKSFAYKFVQNHRKKAFKKCGENVNVGRGLFSGIIELGSNVIINSGAWFVSSRAKIQIHDNVVIAPNVTIYTGSHMINVLGKHICEITDKDKDLAPDRDRWDKDVIIESGCWIGTHVIILKGVTIGRGSVIGAGAVVVKDVPPYSVYVGVPEMKVSRRFSDEQVIKHEQMLKENGSSSDSFS